MTIINFKNTANNPSTFYLGVSDTQNAPLDYLNFSSGAAISDALLSFTSNFQSVNSALRSSTAGWLVKDVVEVPAGKSSNTFVEFQKQIKGETYSFSLVGTLASKENMFTLTGSTLLVKSPYGNAEIKLKSDTTITFEQTNTGKTYETQTELYSGNINASPKTVGALPIGAELRTINKDNLLPTSWMQIGSDTNSFSLLTLQFTDSGSTLSDSTLSGTIKSMKTVNPVDNGPGFQINTYEIGNGKLNPFSSFTPELGIFNSNATLSLISQERSQGPIQINYSTLIPDLPSTDVSVATYKEAKPVSMSTEIGKAGAASFSGDDTFNVTSNTDTYINAGAGNDIVNAGGGNDIIYGGSGDDILNGGAGNDTFLLNQDNAGNSQTALKTTTVDRKTIFKNQLGNDVIDGGAGIDTLSLYNNSQTSELKTIFTQPNNTTFSVWDNFGQAHSISIPSLSNTTYWADGSHSEINKYKIGAIELTNNQDQSKQIFAADFATGEVLYHFSIAENEHIIRTWNGNSNFFYTASINQSKNSITLKEYNLSSTPNNQNSPNWEKTIFVQNAANLTLNSIIQSTDHSHTYLLTTNNNRSSILDVTNSDNSVYEFYTSNTIPTNYNYQNNGFIANDKLYFSANNSNGSNQSFYSINIGNQSYGQITQIFDSNQFWNLWQVNSNPQSIYRIGQNTVDLNKFGSNIKFLSDIELSNGQHLLQLSTSPNVASNINAVDNEVWVIIDSNGNTVYQKSLSANVRSLGDDSSKDGYLYFYEANVTFSLDSSSKSITGVSQAASGPTLYKVPLFALPSILSKDNSSTTLGTLPGVQKVTNFSDGPTQSLTLFEGIYTDENFNANSYLISRTFSPFSNNTPQVLKISVLGESGIQSPTQIASGLDLGVKDFKVANHIFYFLVKDYNSGSYHQSTISYNLATKAIINSNDNGNQFYSIQSGQATVAQAEYFSASTFQPELKLVLPSSYISNKYVVDSTGAVGLYQDSPSDNQNLQSWININTPKDGSIAIGYKNSSGQLEYTTLTNVEFLTLDGENKIDIRPLYLGTKGNDTLYSFSRSGFEQLTDIFLSSGESGNQFFNDSFNIYRNNFAVYTRPTDGQQEWRYYLNAGSGDDTLYGRNSAAENIPVSKLQFNDSNFTGQFQLVFTNSNSPQIVKSFYKSSGDSWSTFSDSIINEINSLNLGFSAQKGSGTNEILISGQTTSDWAMRLGNNSDTTGTHSFQIYDIKNNIFNLTISEISNTEYQIRQYDSQINAHGYAALGVSPYSIQNHDSAINQVYVYNLNTNQVSYHFNLVAGENFIKAWNSTATNFYTEQRNGNSIAIKSYDFSNNGNSHNNNYTFQSESELNGGANDIIQTTDGQKYYLAFDPSNGPGVIYELNNGIATALTNLPGADWYDHLFLNGDQLWFKGNFDWNPNNNTWNEKTYTYNLYDNSLTLIDSNIFWNVWNQQAATIDYSIPPILFNDTIADLGRDALDGGLGADTMIGYSGNDSYFVDTAKDVVIESASISGGFDTVLTSTTYTLDNNTGVERLMVHQIMPGANGNLFTEPRATPPALVTQAVNLTGNNSTYELIGHNGANIITAGTSAGITKFTTSNEGALLLGLGGNDTLIGSERDDHLFGGTGDDILIGNGGNDYFYMGYLSGDILNPDLIDSYPAFNNFGINNQLYILTGGNDTASGGEGFDSVVIATDTSGDASPFYIQRISETQLKIYTVAESMVVDNTIEAIQYQPSSGSFEFYMLPWATTIDNATRDGYSVNYYEYSNSHWAWAAPSDYSDLIDLNSHPGISDTLMSTFDAGKGNDIVYGDRTGRFSTLHGGDNSDWIFNGAFHYSNTNSRYQMYGDAGDDTLTLNIAQMSPIDANAKSAVLLDGGAGNDNYRVLVNDSNIDIQIQDSAGKDSLTLYAANSGDINFDILWDQGQLQVYADDNTNHTRNLILSSQAGTLENLYVAFYTDEASWYNPGLVLGGNIVQATSTTYATGKMVGTTSNDVLLDIPYVRLNMDGGAGDDIIMTGKVDGNIISGGTGNNSIFQSNYVDLYFPDLEVRNTISYLWAPTGSYGEINLQTGLGYIVDSKGALLGSDRWEMNLITDVSGGAANERIIGSTGGNTLDGGAGDDIIYSGGNQPGSQADHLIGGLGNDIVIEESYWYEKWYWTNDGNGSPSLYELMSIPGSIMEGGAGNDVYAVARNGTPTSSFSAYSSGNAYVNPTQIIEHDAIGKDTGGKDTIRFSSPYDKLNTYNFVQIGNLVQIKLDTDQVAIGDSLVVQFLNSATPNNSYTVSNVVLGTGDAAGTSIVEFSVSTNTKISGAANVATMWDIAWNPIIDWIDSNTLASFDENNSTYNALNDVSNGGPTAQYVNKAEGLVTTNLSIEALIDKNALDFLDFGSGDPEHSGFVLPISFNMGQSNGLEVIISGGPGAAALFGGNGTDLMIDTPYDDIIIGGSDNDIISSQFGFDIVDAGAGNDRINFRSDKQVIIGGSGADTFNITGFSNSGSALIADYKPWEGDIIQLDDVWLGELMKGHGPGETSYVDISFNFDPTSWITNSSDAHIVMSLTYESNNVQNNTVQNITENFDLLRFTYNHDIGSAYDQIDAVMNQLTQSAERTLAEQDNFHFTINHPPMA